MSPHASARSCHSGRSPIAATVSAFVMHLALRGRPCSSATSSVARGRAGEAPRGEARPGARGGQLQDARAGRDRRAHAPRHGAAAARAHRVARSARRSDERRAVERRPRPPAEAREGRRERTSTLARPLDPHCAWGSSAARWASGSAASCRARGACRSKTARRGARWPRSSGSGASTSSRSAARSTTATARPSRSASRSRA
jgi:hypothetical protein